MTELAAKVDIPVLLLKTKSTPADNYEDYFRHAGHGAFRPIFVPVLEHRFKQDALQCMRSDILKGAFNLHATDLNEYGGIIFTSQRAVEAFTQVVESLRSEGAACDQLLPPSLVFYVVGPATARGLRALSLKCKIIGEETGNGEALAKFILDSYRAATVGPEGVLRTPLLFPVGEQRRDIIPNTLQSTELMKLHRIKVDELVVYETAEAADFRDNFSSIWYQNRLNGHELQWVVVFSPQGCKAMLWSLGLLDPESGKVKESFGSNDKIQRRTLVATIGPTTRDYLTREFGFEPDVCAAKPSPEGVGEGIKQFMEQHNITADT